MQDIGWNALWMVLVQGVQVLINEQPLGVISWKGV